MKRLVVCALIGGGIGAGVAFTRSDPTVGGSESSGGMKNAAISGAAGGAFLGFVLDRRAKRRKKRESATLLGYAEKARPRVDAAVDAAFAAAEIALPILEARAGAAREKAKETAVQAAGVARRKAKKSGHPKTAKALDLLPV